MSTGFGDLGDIGDIRETGYWRVGNEREGVD